MNFNPLLEITPLELLTDAERAQICANVIEQIRQFPQADQLQAAWEQLNTCIAKHPNDAPLLRLLASQLQHHGHSTLALAAYCQALRLNAGDSQAHYGLAGTLMAQGVLPQALLHFREALRCQCAQPKIAKAPPWPAPLDPLAAEQHLWRVLAQLAAAGVHAFPTAGTLLGLVREGRLLPFDKDLDIGLPFEQMDAAAACLQANGWQRKINVQGMVNPQEWHGFGVVLDLCGYTPDPASHKVIGGFWFHYAGHPWSRITEFPDLTLKLQSTPYGQVWQLNDPEAILVPMYGTDWRTPEPDFDSVIAAHNLRGCSLLTQCYTFARIYEAWLIGRQNKAYGLVRYTLRHLPEDALLHEAARLIAGG